MYLQMSLVNGRILPSIIQKRMNNEVRIIITNNWFYNDSFDRLVKLWVTTAMGMTNDDDDKYWKFQDTAPTSYRKSILMFPFNAISRKRVIIQWEWHVLFICRLEMPATFLFIQQIETKPTLPSSITIILGSPFFHWIPPPRGDK